MARRRGRPKSPETQEKKKRALQLHLRGWSFERIGRQLGVSQQRAHQLYQEAMREIPEPEAHEARKVALAHLQTAIEGLRPRVKAGDPKAAQVWVQAVQRYAKLLGLDAPTRVTGPDGGPLQIAVSGLSDEELQTVLSGQVRGPVGAPPSSD